jgi:hypothetical protein
MEIEEIHLKIRHELGIGNVKNGGSFRGWGFADDQQCVSRCTGGVLVFEGAFPADGQYPRLVQNLIKGVGEEEFYCGDKPMQSNKEVKIVGFVCTGREGNRLIDILKYTDEELFPNLVGLFCYGNLTVRDSEGYAYLQKIMRRVKYLICDGGAIVYHTNGVPFFDPFQPPSYTGPREIKFDCLRYAQFSCVDDNHKFKLDLPNCELISVKYMQGGSNTRAFYIVPNKTNKYFELSFDSFDAQDVPDKREWGGIFAGFDYVKEALFRIFNSLDNVSSIMTYVFMPMGNLRKFWFKRGSTMEDRLPGFFESCEGVLDFIVKKRSLETAQITHSTDYDHEFVYKFTKSEDVPGFPGLVFSNKYCMCLKACSERDTLIRQDIVEALSSLPLRVNVTQRALKNLSLEELMGSLTLSEKVIIQKYKRLELPDAVLGLIGSFIFPKG